MLGTKVGVLYCEIDAFPVTTYAARASALIPPPVV
jgi:hypothetical protein